MEGTISGGSPIPSHFMPDQVHVAGVTKATRAKYRGRLNAQSTVAVPSHADPLSKARFGQLPLGNRLSRYSESALAQLWVPSQQRAGVVSSDPVLAQAHFSKVNPSASRVDQGAVSFSSPLAGAVQVPALNSEIRRRDALQKLEKEMQGVVKAVEHSRASQTQRTEPSKVIRGLAHCAACATPTLVAGGLLLAGAVGSHVLFPTWTIWQYVDRLLPHSVVSLLGGKTVTPTAPPGFWKSVEDWAINHLAQSKEKEVVAYFLPAWLAQALPWLPTAALSLGVGSMCLAVTKAYWSLTGGYEANVERWTKRFEWCRDHLGPLFKKFYGFVAKSGGILKHHFSNIIESLTEHRDPKAPMIPGPIAQRREVSAFWTQSTANVTSKALRQMSYR